MATTNTLIEKENEAMHGDLENLLGGGHEFVHHDTHFHDDTDEAALLAQSAVEGTTQLFTLSTNLMHLLQDTAHLSILHQHSMDHQDHQADTDPHGTSEWQDVSGAGHTPHLHLLRHSDAADTNGDGISDAASRDLGIDPNAVNTCQTVHVDWQDASGHTHHAHGRDSDGDGWADDVERFIGTDPYAAASHPSLVEAHHFPAGSNENLPGTVDITPSSSLWYSL